MAITHVRVVVTGNKGEADDWNDDHVIGDVDKPKNFTTLIVAASNSLDTARADYVCDGIDDQEEINAAIAALPAGGGRISLQEGQFEITGQIIPNRDNISIEGLGPATVLNTTMNDHVIQMTGRDNCVIKAVRIVGNGVGANQEGVNLSTCVDCTVRECWFDTMGGASVVLNRVNGGTVTDNWFFDFVGYGIHIWNASSKCVIKGNVFRNSASFSIYVSLSIGMVIIGNVSNVRAYMSQAGNSLFSLNSLIPTAGDGLALVNSDNCSITGNSILDSPGDNIDLDANSDDNIIIGNQLTGAGGLGLDDNGAGNDAAHNKV